MRVDPLHARQLLGLDTHATPREVQSAFRQRARELHPDTAAQQRAPQHSSLDLRDQPDQRAEEAPVDEEADLGRLREARDVLLREQRGYRHLADQATPRRAPTGEEGGWRPYTFDLDLARPAGVYRVVDGRRPPVIDLRV